MGATTLQPNAPTRNDTKRHEERFRTSSDGTRRHVSTQNDTNRHERPSTWSRTRTGRVLFLRALPLADRARDDRPVHRKVVTVLFCDVVGSTALGESVDPEAVQALLARYFERMKGIVESHGGSVEKFIGDAVMAVFGVPAVHEDDALRAVRAAVEMRDALPELGLQGRIGVDHGRGGDGHGGAAGDG